MSFILLVPAVFSLLLLAAHFLRNGWLALVALCLLLPLLLLVRRRWVPWLFQGVLLLGALEWVRTMALFVDERQALEQPWLRLAVILSSVALFTILSGVLFYTPTLRRRYRH